MSAMFWICVVMVAHLWAIFLVHDLTSPWDERPKYASVALTFSCLYWVVRIGYASLHV